ncbi:hypothetical protein [Streptococcus suis]|uniref:Uncharacterized protein n=1 Tax=Streptococcus suis TaxID=1307 RepID=A0A116MZL1_STRSU|nr:hypothetical protein [Streptococcus suis]CYV74042.1 Uncharacterised protein [Streptococcus suis]
MKFFRELKTDYLESRFSAYESFAEWFLKRKLGFWGKMIFAYLLWLVWIFSLATLITSSFSFMLSSYCH